MTAKIKSTIDHEYLAYVTGFWIVSCTILRVHLFAFPPGQIILIIPALAILLFGLLHAGPFKPVLRQRWFHSRELVPWLLFSVVSLAWSVSPLHGAWLAVGIAASVTAFAAGTVMNRIDPGLLVIRGAFAIALVILGIYVVTERMSADDTMTLVNKTWQQGTNEWTEAKLRIVSGRTSGGMGTPALAASFAVMLIPLMLAGILEKTNAGLRAASGAALAAAAAILIITRSAGAMVSFSIALAITAATIRNKKRWHIFAIAVLLASLAAGSVLFLRHGFNLKDPNNSMVRRIGNWKGAIELISQKPWAGWGLGGFGGAYASVKTPSANETRFAHNGLLQLTAETGIPAVSILVFVIIIWWRKLLRMMKTHKNNYTMLAVQTGAITFAVHSLVDMHLHIVNIAVPGLLLCGMGISPRLIGQDDAKRIAWTRNSAWTSTLAVIMWMGILFSIRFSYAEHLLSSSFAQTDVQKRFLSLKKVPVYNPLNADLKMAVADLLISTGHPGNIEMADKELAAAEHIEPMRAIITAKRAMTALARNDEQSAFILIDKAIAKYPSGYRYHLMKGDMFMSLGDHAGALAEYELALSLNPSQRDRQHLNERMGKMPKTRNSTK